MDREISQHRDYSEETALIIDAEVKKIVDLAMQRALKVLNENMDTMHKLAEALLEREILDGDEIDRIMKGEKLPPYDKTYVNGVKNGTINPDAIKTDSILNDAAKNETAENDSISSNGESAEKNAEQKPGDEIKK